VGQEHQEHQDYLGDQADQAHLEDPSTQGHRDFRGYLEDREHQDLLDNPLEQLLLLRKPGPSPVPAHLLAFSFDPLFYMENPDFY
tara:strand:- start:121 stop:375 length:255 start_codon:yes stop_codon:yes gene_type:complete